MRQFSQHTCLFIKNVFIDRKKKNAKNNNNLNNTKFTSLPIVETICISEELKLVVTMRDDNDSNKMYSENNAFSHI